MPKESAPNCPRCGRTDVKPLSTSECYLNDPPAPGERPVSTVTVYLCTCGETFTQVVKVKQDTPK
ncbi:MAG TPA: hypothetical protein VMP01_09040 [Pirellulaceae bacterium]|nr:hypothetical protein [Pirellulaceae bacterium]